MPTYASAFACQCACDSCSIFKIRQASRNFKFAIIDGHHFISYTHHQTGTPNIDFHEEWSVDRVNETYGTSVSDANNPDPERVAAGTNFVRNVPSGMVGGSGTGRYIIRFNGATNLSELIAFVPGPLLEVEYQFGTNRQIFSNELTEAQLNAILEADLADSRESFYRPNDPNLADHFMNIYSPYPSSALSSGMWNQFIGVGDVRYGGWVEVCNRVDLLSFGSFRAHALRFSRGDERHLQECIVYKQGDHNITEHSIVNSVLQPAILSCRNITVPSGGSYTITPPTTNNRAYIWHDGGRC